MNKKNLIIILLMILCISRLYAGLFDDVPKDHWAYEAINSLAEKGYVDGFPDGTFKGNTPVSRYEMAVSIFKVLNKVKDIETSGGVITQKDAATIHKLITEFRDELNALGVRVEKLEERVTTLEKNQKSLDKEDNRFKITGEYYGKEECYRYTDSNKSHGTEGFQRAKQYVSLFLTAKPSDQTEIYTRLEGSLNNPEKDDSIDTEYSDDTRDAWLSDGSTHEMFTQKISFIAFSDPATTSTKEVSAITFDDTKEADSTTAEIKYKDKYAKSVTIKKGNKNLFHIDKTHFKMNTDRADFRVYTGGEDFSALTDPLSILNWNWEWIADIVSFGKPFAGIESNGNLTKNVSWFGSVLRQEDAKYDENGDPMDFDIASSRLTYTFPKGLIPNSNLALGTSYVDYIKDLHKDHFSRLQGIDFTYSYQKDDKKATWTGEFLKNDHGKYNDIKPYDSTSGSVYAIGYNSPASREVSTANGFWSKLDYTVGDLGFNYEYYNYGDKFWIETAPWFLWRYHYGELYGDGQYEYGGRTSGWINDLAGRGWIRLPESFAERHNRAKTSYTFNLGNNQSIITEAIYDRLQWGPNLSHQGELYKFHAIPKMSSRFSGDFLAYKHLDDGDNEGRFKTQIKINTVPNTKNNSKWEIGAWAERDADNLDSAHNSTRNDGLWSEYSFNPNDEVWLKLFTNYNQSDINFIDSNGDNKQKDDNKIELESNIDITSILSANFDAYIYHEWFVAGGRNTEKYGKIVLTNNFTQNLKGKIGYFWKKWNDNAPQHHFHLDFTYQPDNVSEIRLEYSPDDVFDKGDKENKMYRLSASTKF